MDNSRFSLKRYLRQEEQHTDLLVSQTLIIIFFMSAFVIMLNSALTGSYSTNRANMISMMVGAGFYSGQYLFIRKREKYRPYIKYVVTLFNVSVITFTLLQYCLLQSWVHGLRSSTSFLYFLPYIVAILYNSPRLCLLTGFLTALEYSSVALYAIHMRSVPMLPYESFARESYSYSLMIFFDLFFLMAGILSFIVARRIRSVLHLAVKSNIAADKEKHENLSRSRFFLNIAHEIKTPLTLIENYFNRYREKTSPSEELSIIETNITRMKRDIIHFMDLEKLKNQTPGFTKSHCELSRVSGDILRSYALTYPGIKWSVDIEEDLVATGDQFLWNRILYNILDNAVKYGGGEGRIEFALRMENKKVKLTLNDFGPGIPEESLPHIFEPYYQLNQTKSSKQGMGMGLAIVKSLCKSIDADIRIDSPVSGGASVTLLIHMGNKEQVEDFFVNSGSPAKASIPRPRLISADSNRKSKTILVIEDHDDLRTFLVSELQNDYNVLEAENGERARRFFESGDNEIDLVLSDIMMDEMSGLDFFRLFNCQYKERFTPFLFLTARTDEETKKTAHELGAMDFMEKPFNSEDLQRKIASILKIGTVMKEEARQKLNEAICLYMDRTPESEEAIMCKMKREFRLSDRELEITLMIKQGKNNKELGEALHISPNTVKTHVSHIFEKCGVNNRIELIARLNHAS